MAKINIRKQCERCNKVKFIEVEYEDYKSWKLGALIQIAMPYLRAWESEMFISGICPDCWDEIMAEPEEG